jgi:hypothetical protein
MIVLGSGINQQRFYQKEIKKMTSPFDYINAIGHSKKDMMADEAGEKDYNAWMINKGFSYFPDTIEYANNMNMLYHLDSRLQYEYLTNIIRSRKRFSKWTKKKQDKNVELVMTYYKCSNKKADEYLKILSPKQIKQIKEYLETGTE